MAFLDFIKNRQTGRERVVAERPQQETTGAAKEHFARQDAADKAGLRPVQQLSGDQKKQVEAIKKALSRYAPDRQEQVAPEASTNSGGSPEALRQNQSGQECVAPAESPTTVHQGKSEPDSVPSKAPAEKPRKPQTPTVPRRPPSWER
jgi:hypothetical protein